MNAKENSHNESTVKLQQRAVALFNIGVLFIVAGIAAFQLALEMNAEAPATKVAKDCQFVKREFMVSFYTCPGSVDEWINTIDGNPELQQMATDHETNTVYLRREKYVFSVKDNGDGTSQVTVEDHQRLNSGTFVHLGPYFRPSSPRSSSGGDSGGFGVK
ncbi:DUF4247 domain-containing protein [Corynebacterium felinum]|uniref:DUF4247 domain-containing protein n=1 Tax=Corynebacterium felinum TaxID=131318 RepID=A0ABU2B8A1_9CORY|nr:DUF4247 domain-containing protein [Corynebacterium felinum]MDF5820208.1 DUF4247 domain-containing protein [Corynebacterium felinum]MDR7354847.1 hypothetical protein [Corynebacterium felinum]WJY94207.1 hypothetical protein CFELI_02825 [Corynebacterium felinum]